jgi:hypothetical protein
MKDKEPKLEKIEASHTLGRAGEGRVQGTGKWRGCTSYPARRQRTSRTLRFLLQQNKKRR